MRLTIARGILIVVTLVVVVLFYVPIGHVDLAERWGEGTYGVDVTPTSLVVIDVEPGSSAAAAGIRIGDTIEARVGSRQAALLRAPYVGQTADVTFLRDGRSYRAHLVAIPTPNFDIGSRVSGLLPFLPATVFLVVACMLVFVRPDVMTWAYYIYAVGFFGTGPPFMYWAHTMNSVLYAIVAFVMSTLLGPLAILPLPIFLLRFPRGTAEGWRAPVERWVWGLIVVSSIIVILDWLRVHAGHNVPSWQPWIDNGLPLLCFVLSALLFVKNYKTATPEVRQRLGFLSIGVIVAFLAYAVYYVPGIPFVVGQIFGVAAVLGPITVAYAVFRHRVLDVGFVLNRAAVYGVISLLIIAAISVLDWLTSNMISAARLATAVNLLVTVGIGFLLDRINRTVTRVVDTLFFSDRRRAEEYVRKAAAALPYATKEASITDGLINIPSEAFSLSAATLYRRSDDGTGYVGVATSEQTPHAPRAFDADHLLVRMLRADESIVWLDSVRSHLDAENTAVYVVALPVTVRHDVVSFVLYGAHTNGSQLDPEEIAMLQELAREAARAYDHVEAVRMRDRFTAMTALKGAT
ncbi:MAG: hypothetical protein ACYDA1_06225 [Vulcanimicrobiaceae bacterium]